MAGLALLAQLEQLRGRVAPVTLAAEQLLAVPEAFQPLFAGGGLPRGSSVGFAGVGSWSVAMALAASALGVGGWLAVLGVEELGLVAAAEVGVRLDRVLVVSSVASAQLGLVAATLMEAVDVIALHPRSMVSARDARRLTARAREQGTVLFHLDGGRHWPEALDLSVSVVPSRCVGIGEGHGHLQFRQLEVATTGRRAANRQRRVSVLAGGPGGSTLERVGDPSDVAGWGGGRNGVEPADPAGGVGAPRWAGSAGRMAAAVAAGDGIVWADGVDGVVWADGEGRRLVSVASSDGTDSAPFDGTASRNPRKPVVSRRSSGAGRDVRGAGSGVTGGGEREEAG
ncbi:MAG: hypothetical protein OEY41_15190 [Acidimicrobiia bacterium]|nr:hypothetical protein [Acidimicrobiia bacterium]